MIVNTNSVAADIEVQLRSIEQTCRILGLGRTKINELVAGGQLRSVKIGRKVLIPQRSITGFLQAIGA